MPASSTAAQELLAEASVGIWASSPEAEEDGREDDELDDTFEALLSSNGFSSGSGADGTGAASTSDTLPSASLSELELSLSEPSTPGGTT